MPYIDPQRRKQLGRDEERPLTAGELNYVLTKGLLDLQRNDDLRFGRSLIETEIEKYLAGRNPSYTLYNEVMGALTGCALEWRRRTGDGIVAPTVLNDALRDFYFNVVAPYEDDKINQNGDIYQ